MRFPALLVGAALLAAPPALAQARAKFEKSLAADPYFKDLTLDVDDSHAPLVVYVQPPRKRDAAYLGEIATKHAALFERVERAFETSFGSTDGTSAVPPPPGSRFLPLVVLTDEAEVERRRESGSAAFDMRFLFAESSFGRALGAGIVYEGLSGRKRGKKRARRCSSYDRVQVMTAMLMYERAQTDRSRLDDWLATGAAERFARLFDAKNGAEVDALGFPPSFDRAREESPPWDDQGRPLLELRNYANALRAIPRRALVLRPFRDFAQQRDVRAARRQLEKDSRSDGRIFSMIDSSTAAYMFQSRLLVDYLADEHGPAFDAYLGDWFRGQPMGPAQASRFPDPDAVDSGFDTWLVALGEIALPEGGLDLEAIGSEDPKPIGASSAPTPTPTAAPEPVSLTMDDASGTERAALVLAALSEGRASDALAALDLVPTGEDAAFDAWIARERVRIESWIRARDAFAASLPGSKTKLRVQGAEKSVMARVERLEDGVLVLKKNSAGVTAVPVDGTDPRVLGRAMAKRDRLWEGALAEVWTDDERGAKALRGTSPEIVALAEDVAAHYGDLRAAIPSVRALDALVQSASEPDWPASLDGMEAVRATLEEHSAAPCVASRIERLEAWTAWRFRALAEATPLEDLVHGEVELLEGERVRIRYDFSSDEQLLDFEDQPERDPTRAIEVEPLAAEFPRVFQTSERRLKVLGWQTRVHAVTLGAPLRFGFGFRFVEMNAPNLPWDVLTGFGTGPNGIGIWARNYFQCYVATERSRNASRGLNGMVKVDVLQRVEVEQREDGVYVAVNDEDLGSMDSPPERLGRFTIASCTGSTAALEDVVIEGRFGARERALTAAAIAAAAQRRFWTGLR
ncbi:MAG: hypothetical protein AAFP22_03730 [Planctomycetota bacterium]